jgi:hypothetical protein
MSMRRFNIVLPEFIHKGPAQYNHCHSLESLDEEHLSYSQNEFAGIVLNPVLEVIVLS